MTGAVGFLRSFLAVGENIVSPDGKFNLSYICKCINDLCVVLVFKVDSGTISYDFLDILTVILPHFFYIYLSLTFLIKERPNNISISSN